MKRHHTPKIHITASAAPIFAHNVQESCLGFDWIDGKLCSNAAYLWQKVCPEATSKTKGSYPWKPVAATAQNPLMLL